MKNLKSIKRIFSSLSLVSILLVAGAVNAEEVIVSGTFKGASNHTTTGAVSVVETAEGLAVVLGSDFSFDGAPDPKVGFGKSGKYDISTQLAHLQSNSGEQVYQIPDSVIVSDYNEIYIWCEAYSVPLGVAKIK